MSSSVIFLITRQGLPTATTSSGISFVTTEPAPITECLPMLTPGTTVTLPPSQAPSPILIVFAFSMPSFLASTSKGCIAP